MDMSFKPAVLRYCSESGLPRWLLGGKANQTTPSIGCDCTLQIIDNIEVFILIV